MHSLRPHCGFLSSRPEVNVSSTIVTARLHKKQLLVALLLLAVVANLLTTLSQGLPSLVLTRFLSGLPQGIYFGAASVVATRMVGPAQAGRAVSLVFLGISIATILGAPAGTAIGQLIDWRIAYGVIGLVALLLPMWTPVAQTVIGLGIALGALWGGGLADRYRFRALVLNLLGAIMAMGFLYVFAHTRAGLLGGLFAASFLLNAAVPSITVQMMRLVPQAPTMMGALNMASFNIANAVGAVGGAEVLDAGWGHRSPILAGLGLTCVALAILAIGYRRLTRA